MKFFLLKKFSEFLNIQTHFSLKRLNASGFLLETFSKEKHAFVVDLSAPYIGLSKKPPESVLKNTLVLDFCLNKFTKNAKILQANVIDNDRILEIKGAKDLAYKSETFILRLEMIPKKANLMILDKEKCVIEAFRFNDRVAKNDILGALPPNIYEHQEEDLDFKGLLDILEKDFLFYQHKELEHKKNQIIKRLNAQKERLKEKLEKLEDPKNLQLEAKELQTQASLLLTYQHLIHKHESRVVLKDFEDKECMIEIDKSMPLNAFINKKFTLSKKKKQKSQFLYLEEENLKEKIAFKENQINYVRDAAEESVLEMFMPFKNSKIKRPMNGYEVLYYKDFKIGLGKNQKENIKLLQDARANDLWMHVRNIPGSHLIVFCQKNTPKDEIIMELAKMLIKMQKDAFNGYEIDYTQRKFVKIIKGANVIYSKYRTISLKDT
ncbi:hypothetical protein DD741_07320 [Helicobacter pylori]|uniref:NFACT family protein n=1 Tax=Helicobacter pylori TaxID=210 RepID=UPI000EB1058C|nr:NFACT family protein [Helicobacter pylori]RKV25058.1 hypothetical protein DD741_07320 [Helicobacter pylori]